ncbi:nectin-4-like isoform X1 [Clupea harengus]|uniref:Nectin-4-like isoform X1 n=1 Tax=Clupea harengus TaxID=7950 RepID=A0A6P8GSY9_CLUHA|nr:nectin-4-like isoform X1 [Clupea harengus]
MIGIVGKLLLLYISLVQTNPPQSVKISVTDADTVYECSADANTPTQYTWTREGQPLPSTGVRAEGHRLVFLEFTSELNGLYTCEVTTPEGAQRATITRYVTTGGSKIDFSLLAVVTIGAVLIVTLWQCVKRRKQQRSLKALLPYHT